MENIMIILCGSSMSFIEKEVLAEEEKWNSYKKWNSVRNI